MSFPNRYMCEALDEMRALLKNLSIFNHYRYKKVMAMIIEEVQAMGNKMEGALSDKDDISRYEDERRDLKLKVKKLKRQVKNLEFAREELEDEDNCVELDI